MHTSGMSPEWALNLLTEGNERYCAGRATHPHQTLQRRESLAGGQSPFAVILTCSDSRVSPEILFDRGVGDLFVIRTAGNVVDDIGIGSIEYAVAHLGTSLVMVLGHTSCGAVTAAVQGGEAEGHIGAIVEAIAPAVEAARGGANGEAGLLGKAINENVRKVVAQLSSSRPILADAVDQGHLLVIGGLYDIVTGKVTPVR
ncbi:MAG: carbonic anhydrase [Acidobacteria bacterium]|nr:carbonic anhydrase [Acidobacteriota bacterium]